MTSLSKGPVCKTCNRSHEEEGYRPMHGFNDGTLPMSATFGRPGPAGRTGGVLHAEPEIQVVPAWPFDPVLRQALIDKGVLTPEDLTEAERKIRLVTGQAMGGEDNGTQL